MIVLFVIAQYTGMGAQSVSKETLAKYQAAPLPSDATREVQSMLDVRGVVDGIASHDGKQLFYNWTVTGNKQVWVADGANKYPRQLTGGEDATKIVGVAPNGKYIVLERDRKGEENPGVYLQSPNGGALELVQHKAGMQSVLQFISPDSRYVYFRSNDVKPTAYAIYRYDTVSKKRETVFGADGIGEQALWIATDWRAGKVLLGKEIGSNMTEYYELDEAKKTVVPLFGQGEREDYVARYGAGEDILVMTPKLSDFRRLYAWKAGKFTPISPDVQADVEAFFVNDDRSTIAIELNDKGYFRPVILDARTYKAAPAPQLPKVDNAGIVALSGRFVTLAVNSAQLLNTLFVLDTLSGKAEQWVTSSAPEHDVSQFVNVTLESYPARDGTQIPAFVRRPTKCATKPCPVIVQFHGGPEGQAHGGYNGTAQLFADAGFIFVEPNVRGSDGYGKAWLHADDGAKRLNVVTDIEDAAKWARTKFAEAGVAPKVGVYGGSYGGYSVLAAMTMFAGAYDAGLSVVGISNMLTFLENTAPYRRALRISEYGDPVKDREALIKLSPTTYIDRVKAPLFIVQGATDPRVPAGEAIQMHEAMQKKGLASKLIVFPDEGHGVAKRENRVLYLGHALRFFREHLAGIKPAT